MLFVCAFAGLFAVSGLGPKVEVKTEPEKTRLTTHEIAQTYKTAIHFGVIKNEKNPQQEHDATAFLICKDPAIVVTVGHLTQDAEKPEAVIFRDNITGTERKTKAVHYHP